MRIWAASRGQAGYKKIGMNEFASTSGGDCTPTIQEDQDAYTTWQVEQKLGPYMHNVFGT
jgi:hypothetical protein